MIKKAITALRGRVGPLGLSLLAAALTAVAFAAVSVAQEDGSKDGSDRGDAVAPGPPGPGHPMIEELSDEDRQALEEFRQCMEDHGAPAPPRPPEPGEPGEDGEDGGEGGSGRFERRLDPPSEEERAKIEEAFEACKDMLPEGVRHFGPGPCGPPPPPGGPDGAAVPAPPPGAGSQEGEQQGTGIPAPEGAAS